MKAESVRYRVAVRGDSVVFTVRVPTIKETGSIRAKYSYRTDRKNATELAKRVAASRAASEHEPETVDRAMAYAELRAYECPEEDYEAWQEWRDYLGLAAIPFVTALEVGGVEQETGPALTVRLGRELRYLDALTDIGLCMVSDTMELLDNADAETTTEGHIGGTGTAPAAPGVGTVDGSGPGAPVEVPAAAVIP